MLQRIGIFMLGATAVLLILGSSFIFLFKSELTQWNPVPPLWIYKVFGCLLLFGLTGVVITIVGLLKEAHSG